MPRKALKAPPHLSREASAWWSEVVAGFLLEAHHLKLLTLAAEAWDRCAEARARLAAEGLTIEGREGGLRPHPCVSIERDARAAFAALVKQLGLDDATEPKRGVGRPAGTFNVGGK